MTRGKKENPMLNNNASADPKSCDPTVREGSGEAEQSKPLAESPNSVSGAQTAQGPDLYTRALARLDKIDYENGFVKGSCKLLRALLVERQKRDSLNIILPGQFILVTLECDAALREFVDGCK